MRARQIRSDDDRWEAVRNRRKEADGQFYYAVRTTGIYCRPTCASRRPKRANVEFFLNHTAAEEAGYRPCLRCRPAAAAPEERHLIAIRKACTLMDEAEEPLPLEALAEAVGLSRSHFHRLFTQVVGVRPKEYADALRLERLKSGLEGGLPVTDAIYEAGYGSSSRVYEGSRQTLGMTPAQYRAGGRGQTLRFASARTDLGRLVVAATDRGVCSIELLDPSQSVSDHLRRRFAAADLQEDEAYLGSWIQAIVRFIVLPQEGLDLPLDIRGTAFQRRVWKALRQIPVGTTMSYGQVAAAIGHPSAARAVANACASNPVALVIPCHRVVRKDGHPGGYRWGEQRKENLLLREATATAEP